MRSLGGFSSPWHFLWTSVDRSSSLFLLGICSWLFHNCSRALWLPSHLSHFEDLQWSAPEPLSIPTYTPPRGATPLCFMRSTSHFPNQWWAWVSLDITKPHPDTSNGRMGSNSDGSLGWDDPLEEDMATHFGILPWRIPKARGAFFPPLLPCS